MTESLVYIPKQRSEKKLKTARQFLLCKLTDGWHMFIMLVDNLLNDMHEVLPFFSTCQWISRNIVNMSAEAVLQGFIQHTLVV